MLRAGPAAKLFEYKITGTLSEPKPEPRHIPKLFYKPILHPFQTLEGIFNPRRQGRMRNRSSVRPDHRHRTNTRNRFTGQLPALAEKVQSVFSAA